MGNTSIYRLGYLDPGQSTRTVATMDSLRFQAIDTQIGALFALFGNGILDDDPDSPSWRIQAKPGDTSGTVCQVTAGSGHVASKYCVTTVTTDVSLTLPYGGAYPLSFWLYAREVDSTPYSKNVEFFASTVELTDTSTYVGLGGVDVAAVVNGTGYVVTAYNDTDHGRVVISLFAALAAIVNKHVHIGGANNPSQIDLALHVQNKLSGANIEDLDASTITQGVFSPERLPSISHTTLTRIGTLTHDQIDSLLGDLTSANSDSRLSDYMVADMLQLAVMLKRQRGNFVAADANLVNAIIYIPDSESQGLEATGIPGGIDLATIDRTDRRVVGTNPTGNPSDTLVWTTDTQWNTEITLAGERTLSLSPNTSNVVVTGSGNNGSVTLDIPLGYQSVATNDLTNWGSGYAFTDDAAKSTGTPPSPAPSYSNHFLDGYAVRRYLFLNFSAPQDWSGCQQLGVGFGLSAQSIPGDIYVYLILANGGTSVPLVLASGTTSALSISTAVVMRAQSDAVLAADYRIVTLANLATTDQLSQVAGIGFYWQTPSGWNNRDVDFYLLFPDSSLVSDPRLYAVREGGSPPDLTSTIFIWNNTLYAAEGFLVIRLDTGYTSTQFDQVNWDVPLPLPIGSQFTVSTRVANTETLLASAAQYVVNPSTNVISGLGNTGRWIDMIVDIRSTPDRTQSPVLELLSLALHGPGSPATKVWDVQADFDNGRTFEDTAYDGNSNLTMADADQVGRFVYLRASSSFYCYNLDGSLESTYEDGGQLYQTPLQVWNGSTDYGMDKARDMTTLQNSNVVIADTFNDRVLEMTASGQLVRAVQGNLFLRATVRDFVALTAIYNPRLGILWIAFSQNVTISDKTKITLATSAGTQSISLAQTTLATAVLFSPLSSLSPTIQVTLSEAARVAVNAWSGSKVVLLSDGCVVSAGSSTDGTIGSGPAPSTGGSSGTGTTPDPTALPPYLTNLYNILGTGTLTGTLLVDGGLDADTSNEPTSLAGDFDGDGVVNTVLQGPGGQHVNVQLAVQEGEIVFDNLYHPVSAQVNVRDEIIVASVGSDAVQAYDVNNNKLWSIDTSVVAFRDTRRGSAYEMDNGNILLAVPATAASTTGNGQVLVVNRVATTSNPSGSPVVVTRQEVEGDAVRGVPSSTSPSEYWIAVNDLAGLKSQIIRISSAGDVLWSWGMGLITHPTGLKLLNAANLLVSE